MELTQHLAKAEKKIWVGKENNYIFVKWDFVYKKDILKTFAINISDTIQSADSIRVMYFKIKYNSWAGNFLIGDKAAAGGTDSWVFGGLAWRGMYIGFSHPFPEEDENVSMYIIIEPSKISINTIPSTVYCSNSLSSTYSGPNDSNYKDPSTFSQVKL